MYSAIFGTIKLLNIFISSHNYSFLMVKILNSHPFRKFQIYNTILLAVVTSLYISSPELNRLA